MEHKISLLYFVVQSFLIITLVNGASDGDLRLSLGHEGLLEIYFNGWGYICQDNWDIRDSNVACKSLGFERASTFHTYNYHPNGTLSFKISNVDCFGNESSISECNYSTNVENCYSYEYFYLDCSLDKCQSYVHNADSSQQIVQYYSGQNWYYICSDNFTKENADVICYENYGTEAIQYTSIATSSLTFGYSFYQYQQKCRGSEASLCNCPIVNQTCDSNKTVTVMCQNIDYGTIRLTNDPDEFLQVYINSGWSYVCTYIDSYYYYYYPLYNNKFLYYIDYILSDTMDIACRELGYSKAKSFQLNFDGRSISTEYILKLGACTKYDTEIYNCEYTRIESNIYCSSRISLRCETESCDGFLQLNDTPNKNQLVQTYTDKSWFYVCFEGFTRFDADVLCQETATTNATTFTSVAVESLTTRLPISPNNYSCNGTETSICTCPIEKSYCSSSTVTSVLCDEPKLGSVRLDKGYYGAIEIYNGEWRTVCDYTFNQLEADIVCRSAGFRRASSYYNSDFYFYFYYFFYYYTISKAIDDVYCLGNETSLLDCTYTNYTYCYTLSSAVCEKDGCETRVQHLEVSEKVLLYRKQWYTLCADEFTQETANLICRENHDSNASRFTSEQLQSTDYPIYPFNFQCKGNENSVCACETVQQTCSSNRIVKIECNEPRNGHVRLSNETSGILEAYLNGWKRVCDYYLSQADSNVVCRYLGYRDALSSNIIYGYTTASGNIFLSNVHCLGNETNLLQCQYSLGSTCVYDNYISCNTEGCQSYIPEQQTNQPVRFYNNENWYYLCYNSISTVDANVICRENGFQEGAGSVLSLSRSQLSIGYEIYPYNITCQGDETSLCDCSITQKQCRDVNVATVKCLPPEEGTLRFSNQYSNLLEIYVNGSWGHICYTSWDSRESEVACRQLGFPTYQYYYRITTTQIGTSYGNNLGNLQCKGNETSLQDCTYSTVTACQYNGITVLYCSIGDCQVGAPFATEHLQLVEYFADQQRYYLCDDGFTDENADVVCREISYTLSISHRGVSELDLPPNTQIYPLQHSCFGNESSLCNCSAYPQMCTSGLVVEVQCGKPANDILRTSSIGKYLEIYSEGWKYICGSYFGSLDALVACRQQGFKNYRTWTIYYGNVVFYWKRNLNCRGNETKLADCPYTSTNRCYYRVKLFCGTENCESILANGDQDFTPVRYYDGHAYYYICKQGFTIETANVVCREGEYGSAISLGEIRSNNTAINYAITKKLFTCNGNERTLCNCSYSMQSCESGLIAQLFCGRTGEGQLRLTSRGLQIYYNQWRDICYQRWDKADSDVACRQLGYRYAISSERLFTYYYSLNTISDVICIGNETKISDCRFHIGKYCDSYDKVLLTCHSGGCQSYAPNSDSFLQIVRYYDNGWYYLCGEGFTQQNAEVVCEENEGTSVLAFSNVNYSDLTSKLPILQRHFNCTGRESSLCECTSTQATCLSNSTVRIQCNSPDHGQVRLSNRYTGVLEVYLNGWGYVCDDGWNRVASEVVCRQLGLGLLINFTTGVEVNNRLYSFLLDDVQCHGNESSIYECAHTSRHNCGNGEHVSITCFANKTTAITIPTIKTTTVPMDDTVPKITSPSGNVTLPLNANDTEIINCVATGIPTPDVYWTRDFQTRFQSNILQITITYLSNGKVFYCVAENRAGRDVVSVTYYLNVTAEDAQTKIEDIMDMLTDVDSISDEESGQTADLTKVYIDAANDKVNIKDEDKNKILEDAAKTTDLIVEKTNGTISNETTVKITGLLSSIINGISGLNPNSNESTENTQQQQESSVATISIALAITLTTLEKFSQRLSNELANSEVNTVRTVTSELITIVVQNVALDKNEDDDETKTGIILPKKTSDDAEYSVSIKLSTKVAVELSTDGESLAIATCIVKRVGNEKSDSDQTTQGSDILTVALSGKSGTVRLTEEVTFSFDIYSTRRPSLSICVFLNGTRWVSDGLTTVQTNFNLTDCKSLHLTSFAVFVTPYNNEKPYIETIALSVISYLLVGISFISLILSLILFIVAGKPFFKVETNIIYFNYCLSMLLATGLFVFGIQVGTFNIVLCKIIAFLLHYFWLAVFTWTLCVGILIMYKIVISVLSTRKIYKFLIPFGWGFPIIIPLITIIIARDYYVDASKHCFLNIEGGVIWAFIAPIFIIVIINAIFLIIAIFRIIQTRTANQNNETRDIIKSALITGLILTPTLGLPWLILLFNIAIKHSTLEWIFIIVNGSMGLIFLIFIVLRNKEVLAIFKKKKQVATSNTQPYPNRNISSSATASSFTSSKFRKTNTMERSKAKELEIEGASAEVYEVVKSPYDMPGNIYEVVSNEQLPFESTNQRSFTGYENPLWSNIQDDPPEYQNLSEVEIVTTVHSNPMYEPSSVLGTDEIYTNIAHLTESDTKIQIDSDEVEAVYESAQ